MDGFYAIVAVAAAVLAVAGGIEIRRMLEKESDDQDYVIRPVNWQWTKVRP